MAESENKVETEEIGSVLKAAREAAGVSLDDVSDLLKIRAVHLQALEEDDFDNLPGSVYAIGFIRTYANHLGLNGAELIGRYKTATTPLHEEEPGYNPQTEVEPVSGALKIAIAVIGVFVFYILWLIAGGAGGSDTRDDIAVAPAVEKSTAIDRAPPAASPGKSVAKSVAKPVDRPQATASAENTTQLAGAPSSANDTQAVLPEADPVAGQPIVEVQPIGQLAGAAAPEVDGQLVARAAQATPAVANAISNTAVAAKVEIRAMRRTWMRIEDVQGKVLFSSIIREGEGFTFGEDDNYTLATRDAGALEYFVDDRLVGAVGRRGQILTARKIERTAILTMAAQ